MKVLFKPVSIIAGVMAGRAASAAFQALWSRIDDHEPPKATTADATLPKVVLAAVLESSTQATAAVVADRAAARTFSYLFGVWPGEKTQPKS
jgi:hypothetical protein